MSFEDIKGQDNAVRFLRGSLAADRVAHAYLFIGPRGVGRMLTAINFAKALNCLDKTNLPCESCLSCRKISALNHPDLLILKPDREGGSLKIEAIRELIRNIYLKPYEGKRKVYIVDGAGLMTQEAANALLKTLEEPPSDSVLILIAESVGDLLRTITSRCQIIRFSPLGTDEVEEILEREHSSERMRAHVVAHLASGRLGEALKMNKDEEYFKKRGALIDAVAKDSFLDPDFEKITREDMRIYLDIMLAWYRDILVCQSAGALAGLINIDRKELILRESKRLGREYLLATLDRVAAAYGYLDSNANLKLVINILAAKIGRTFCLSHR